MIITIDTNTGLININSEILEKEWNYKTIPDNNTPIQYNLIDIKRKYYKKWDPEYHRKPIKKAWEFSKLNRIVKQEPLLDLHY